MTTRSTSAARAALLPLALVLAAACSEAPATSVPAAAAVAAAPTATANDDDESVQAQRQAQNDKMLAFAAGMHALSEACGANTAAELAKMKDDGRAPFLARGMNAAQYDRAFAAAFAQGKAKLAAASPQDRAKACAQLQEMPKAPAGQ